MRPADGLPLRRRFPPKKADRVHRVQGMCIPPPIPPELHLFNHTTCVRNARYASCAPRGEAKGAHG